jgi:hypothetical protein
LPRFVGEFSADLTAVGIRHALSGSIAMAAWSRLRATADAEFRVITPAISPTLCPA